MAYDTLLSPYTLGGVQLSNRIVMAPMTRCRAIGNVPNTLMADYYAARADAGLLISEGVAPSANGLGYARIPGLFSDEQVAGWKTVTDAVHKNGGRIFAQLMHTGRVSHPNNMPDGAQVLAPSAIKATGEMYTDDAGMQEQPEPLAMSAQQVEDALNAYVAASENAIRAGFDGVELHGANGYLIDQFLHACSNQRDDQWGGNVEARNRFALEAARRAAAAIGANRVGIRLSPFGAFNDIQAGDDEHDQYVALAHGLAELNLAYIHIVDHSAMGAPPVPTETKQGIADAFEGTIILSGGYDAGRAEADLLEGRGQLVAFGRPFIANADPRCRPERARLQHVLYARGRRVQRLPHALRGLGARGSLLLCVRATHFSLGR